MSEQQKSLGQIAYEARCAGEGWDSQWGIMSEQSRAIWDAVAWVVKGTVLAEQGPYTVRGRADGSLLAAHPGYRWKVTGSGEQWIAWEVPEDQQEHDRHDPA